METGFNMPDINQEDIDILIDKANDIYGIDKKVLYTLIAEPDQYTLSLTGGMGLTSISIADFLDSSFSNPYDPEDNIMAAAETISKLKAKGLNNEEIILRFIIGKDAENVKLFAKSEYLKAYDLAAKYRHSNK